MGQHSTEPLTATACLKRLRLNLSEDVSKRKPRRKNTSIPGAKSGLEDETAVVAPKGLNVVLQLADASGSSGPPPALQPTDVPSWCTKLCLNRINKLKSEKGRLEEKKQAVQAEIQRRADARKAMVADLSEKTKEITFVGNCISEFRKELKSREVEVAENIQRKSAAFLQENTICGQEMRRAQTARQTQMASWSAFDKAEQTRRNLESTQQQMQTLHTLFDSITAEKTASGVRLREQRTRNTEAIHTVAEAELKRLQTLNEAVKHEQELSAARLKERIEHTQKLRTEEYIRNRTAQFNEFKEASAVTASMQAETAAIIEQLRDKYDATRELQRRLEKAPA